jgi:hypothetical protein
MYTNCFERACTGFDRPSGHRAIPDHQPTAFAIKLTDMVFDIRFDLGLKGRCEHPAGSFTDKVIKHRLRVLHRSNGFDYVQHWRPFLAGTAIPDSLQLVRRRVRRATKPETSSTSCDHNSTYISPLVCSVELLLLPPLYSQLPVLVFSRVGNCDSRDA